MSFNQLLLDDLFVFGLLHGPDLHHRLAFQGDKQHHGDAFHLECGGKVFLLVHVDLVDDQLTVIFLCQLLHDGSHTAARTAPVGVEVDDGGQLALIYKGVRVVLEVPDLLEELFVSQLLDLRFVFLVLRTCRESSHKDDHGHKDRFFHGVSIFRGQK